MAKAPRVVILAAGQGTRMRSAIPKVLHHLGGRPLISYTLETASAVGPDAPIVVVNPGQTQVHEALKGAAELVEQPAARGTGDALRSVPDRMRPSGAVVVLSADVPLLRPETVLRLVAAHEGSGAAATLLTCFPEQPAGLGRVIRDSQGRVERIVEERDLPPASNSPEVNAGVYVFNGAKLWPALEKLSTDNAQREYYLTDVIELLGGAEAVVVDDATEALGINDRRQLAVAEAVLRHRTLDALMLAGVTIEDPATTYIDSGVQVGPDTVIRPMTQLRGASVVGRDSELGPGAQLRDVRAGDRVVIGSSLLEACELGDDVHVGAHCRVRPNTVLASGVQLGTHAEVKNSTIGPGTRLNHFCCVLDSDVGRDVNIGAGTVTGNFDGTEKHRTWIGDGVFVGSNSTLVAPVRLGEGSYVAAGSVVTSDVPPGALAVGRARQRNVAGWVERRRDMKA
jgi:bifunctional UDP-N-acetylglucosamine pyrophosphorylase / glucosamine-1-phosphate N-acetyltransferase